MLPPCSATDPSPLNPSRSHSVRHTGDRARPMRHGCLGRAPTRGPYPRPSPTAPDLESCPPGAPVPSMLRQSACGHPPGSHARHLGWRASQPRLSATHRLRLGGRAGRCIPERQAGGPTPRCVGMPRSSSYAAHGRPHWACKAIGRAGRAARPSPFTGGGLPVPVGRYGGRTTFGRSRILTPRCPPRLGVIRPLPPCAAPSAAPSARGAPGTCASLGRVMIAA
jgi:hypothetical protein